MGDDDKRALGAVWEWTHQYGAALKPPGADTYGEGMRDAKEQVQRLLSSASSMSADLATLRAQRDELKKDRDMWRAECESLSRELGLPPTMRPAEGELARFYALALAQRDEARELVRRYVEGDCLYDERNEEQACNAILRWDEEAKR